MSNRTPALGDTVHVFVHPDHNGGKVDAPAVVTHVDPSDHTVNLTVFADHVENPVRRLTGVTVHPDKAAAVAALDEPYNLLPGHSTDENGKHKPGRNTLTGVGRWRRHDVLHWETAAYFPGGAEARLDEPAEPEPEDSRPDLLTADPVAAAAEQLPAHVDPRDAELEQLRARLAERQASDKKDRELEQLRAQLADADRGDVAPAAPAAE